MKVCFVVMLLVDLIIFIGWKIEIVFFFRDYGIGLFLVVDFVVGLVVFFCRLEVMLCLEVKGKFWLDCFLKKLVVELYLNGDVELDLVFNFLGLICDLYYVKYILIFMICLVCVML